MDWSKSRKISDPGIAYRKAERYCAYQERSQYEVREKLGDFDLTPAETEGIIVRLIENNFINEERFAVAFVTGKFNQKGWGRLKIKQGLKEKRVPEVLIKKALQHIDADAYYEVLVRTIEKKAILLSERNPLKRKFKLQQYAIGKGFEADLVRDALSL
jgi:regulatory protein